MTVYNFNLGIGWASSGVEYAQAYRANIFRKINQKAKFIFTDMITSDNIEHLTHNIGFKDDEVIWLYQYFSDIKIAPTTYTVDQLKESLNMEKRVALEEKVNDKIIRFRFNDENKFVTVYLKEANSPYVDRVEHVSNHKLIRKDYFSYTKTFSEYYTPRDNRAYLYQRRFFNEDGSIAYEQILDGNDELYRFKDAILYSKSELITYFIQKLQLNDSDLVILDRATGIGQSVFRNHYPAKLGIVIHAEHFSANMTDENTILWNNFYEYQFQNADKVDFFITATDAQKELLENQFKHYADSHPRIDSIPVGSLESLHYPKEGQRKAMAMMTASRLANEKHVDVLIKAVATAHQTLPDLTFDIYGKGGEEAKLKKLIDSLDASDYIHLKGHHNLREVYQHYDTYLSASGSEGFGLTLLEAVGSGLYMIGFDVRYGNQTFIKDGENGYLISLGEHRDFESYDHIIADKIIDLYHNQPQTISHEKSYQIAKQYLDSEVERKWENVLQEVIND